MQRKAKRVLLIAAILLGAIAIFVTMSGLRQPPAKKEVEKLDLLVEFLELEAMDANFTVASQGTVLPRTETILSAEVSGTIVEISPKWIAGAVFEPGEVLMRIDPTNYLVAVDQAKALVKQRQIEFDGAEKLLGQGFRAEAEHASAAAALASAQAELVRANRNLERTYIRLPYTGMVRSKESDLGQFVNPGTRLGVVFATDYAEVRLPLTDTDLRFLDLPGASDIRSTGSGNGPGVTLEAIQKGLSKMWTAQIVRTEGVVDESSRVTYAVALIDDPYSLVGEGVVLPVGTFVKAKIKGVTMEGIFRLPRSALRGADELLFVDDDQTVKRRTVSIVRTDSDHVFIAGDVSPGERVILTAIESPVNGMPVRTRVAGE